ncbi:MAG: Tad domain-containing protein [Pseudomonadota bacterium]
MRGYINDDRGSVTFFVVVLSIFLLAFVGLVMDTGRSFSAHSQMQAYVDNVALAMARELDRSSDSVVRAQAIAGEANGLLSGAAIGKSSTMVGDLGAEGGESFAIQEIVYLREPPQVLGSKLDRAEIERVRAASAEEARAVLVIGAAAEVPWTFLNLTSLTTGKSSDGDFDIQTWAVAELVVDQTVEQNPLLAVCAPDQATVDGLQPGQQIQLNKSVDGNWGVGSYGIIGGIQDDENGTCSALTGGARAACLLALNDHAGSSVPNGTVDVQGDQTDQLTGQQGLSINAGLNARFGIYADALAEFAESGAISPDVNTITGMLYTCSGEAVGERTESHGLPIDECFNAGTCDFASPVVTQAALEEYCALTYNGLDRKDTGDGCEQEYGNGASYTTRYDLYQLEIANNNLDPDGPEAPNTCNVANEQEDRRVFDVAFIDCTGMSGVTQSGVNVLGYGQVFLTNPVDASEYYVATFDVDAQGAPLLAGDVPSSDPVWVDEGFTNYSSPGEELHDPYAAIGLTINAIPSVDDRGRQEWDDNAPMLFDSDNYTGQDDDLQATGRGNILIISEDGDQGDPDDDGKGGTLVFRFDEPTYVHSILVFDTETGGTLRVFDEPITDEELHLMNLQGIECSSDEAQKEKCENRLGEDFQYDFVDQARLDEGHVMVEDENNPAQLIEYDENGNEVGREESFKPHDSNFWARGVTHLKDNEYIREMIDQDGVYVLTYTMHADSGSVDDLIFWNERTEVTQRDRVYVEFLGEAQGIISDGNIFTQITN